MYSWLIAATAHC